jgi:predicted type IV restriction endonuclease
LATGENTNKSLVTWVNQDPVNQDRVTAKLAHVNTNNVNTSETAVEAAQLVFLPPRVRDTLILSEIR